MNVSLTPELEAFVENKVSSGRFQSASEVIRAGLRLLEERDEERQRSFMVSSLDQLEAKLIQGLESGPALRMTNADWNSLRRRVQTRLEKAKT
jgi:antitoxin ParD1/3/4